MKLKSKNRRMATPTSLYRVVVATGSSHSWVKEHVSEVVSRPGAVM
jgi:hypothetical protein